ncbi:hypothetical protein T459_20079 [Capsicum annuum]|uniref:Reverse transcriptase Ty1/copia-type domain-containing protein n=1 Tax=Capsicum annuum TaxID=4072 RepID=A0A2G2Z3F6_CAPAN|nr:hypothetical protein T459_20079 [Capsicum annuum]
MLEDGVQSSRYAYTALISGLVKKNMIAKGCVYLDRMIEESFMPNTVLYTSLVKQFLRKREFEFAFKLIDLMERSEIEWDLVTYITLVRGVSRNIRSLDGKWLVPQRLKMTTDSQVHDTAMTVAATNVATTSSTNAPPAMAPAEKLDKFAGNKLLGSKWIFKRKMKADGTIDKYKARLVVKGFKQKECLDYFDTYSPVMRITLIRMLITLAVVCGLKIHQMNVKTSFLNGELEEEIYMEQLEGFVVPGKENKSKDNMSDPLTKDLSRERVKRTSKGMDLRPRTSQHSGNSTKQTGDLKS